MTSNRPYLIRAIYDWVTENGLTPYMVIDARHPSVQVPEQYVSDGKLVLNVASRAVQELTLDNDVISFSARFQGQPMFLSMTPAAVIAIYARENGEGMVFPGVSAEEAPHAPETEPPAGKPSLHIVK